MTRLTHAISVIIRGVRALVLALALVPFTASLAKAQVLYSFSVDKATYTDLTSATAVPIEFGDSIAVVDLGNETFALFGRRYTLTGATPLEIGGNGFMQVVDDTALIVVDAFLTPLGQRPAGSTISYQLEGPHGDGVLKIQWKNGGLPSGLPEDSVNMQIWLYQRSGIIEIRTGPGSVKGTKAYSTGGPWIGVTMAPLTFDRTIEKFWLAGDPAKPRIDTVRNVNFPRMSARPAEGTVYRFTPRAAAGIHGGTPENGQHGTLLAPNPAAQQVHVATTAGRATEVRLLDLNGATLLTQRTASGEIILDLENLPASVYLVATNDGLQQRIEKLVKR